MHDERLDLHKMDFHREEMKKVEGLIMEFIPNMKRIKIVEKMSLGDNARAYGPQRQGSQEVSENASSATKSCISGTTAVHLSMTTDVFNNFIVQINLNSI
jgi:hypothetical protein